MARYGPDISHWQGSVDLARAKPHLDFVFLKATEGTGYVDPTFARRWRQLADLGIPRGAYHFAHPRNAASREAEHFVATVHARGWKAGDVAILDMEDAEGSRGLPASSLRRWVDAWVAAVRRDLPVAEVVFYTYIPYWTGPMGNPPELPAGCVGWIARYRGAGPWGGQLPRPRAWPDPPAIWQFTNGSSGRVRDLPGIGKVDVNEMTEACFQRLFRKGDWFDMATKEELAAVVRQQVEELVRDIYPLLARGEKADGHVLPTHFPLSLTAIREDTKAIREKVEHL